MPTRSPRTPTPPGNAATTSTAAAVATLDRSASRTETHSVATQPSLARSGLAGLIPVQRAAPPSTNQVDGLAGRERSLRIAAAAKVHRGQWIIFGASLSPRLATFTACNVRVGKYREFVPLKDWTVERFTADGGLVHVAVRYTGRARGTHAEKNLAAGIEPFTPRDDQHRTPLNVIAGLRDTAARAAAIAQQPGMWGEVAAALPYAPAHRRAERIRAGELAAFAAAGMFDAVAVPEAGGDTWAVWATIRGPADTSSAAAVEPAAGVRFRKQPPGRRKHPGELLTAAAARAVAQPGRWIDVRPAATEQAAISLINRIRAGHTAAFPAGQFDAVMQTDSRGRTIVQVRAIPAGGGTASAGRATTRAPQRPRRRTRKPAAQPPAGGGDPATS